MLINDICSKLIKANIILQDSYISYSRTLILFLTFEFQPWRSLALARNNEFQETFLWGQILTKRVCGAGQIESSDAAAPNWDRLSLERVYIMQFETRLKLVRLITGKQRRRGVHPWCSICMRKKTQRAVRERLQSFCSRAAANVEIKYFPVEI